MLGRRDERQGDMPGRRARRAAAKGPRTDSERIAAVAHEAHVPVEEVLRDVADFRLALETDMIIAAAAADAESPEILSDVLDTERLELATFHDRLLTRLADAAADDELAVRRARKAPKASRVSRTVAVAAAALALFGAGRSLVGGPGQVGETANVAAMNTANQQYADFTSAVINNNSPAAVRDAARELHQTLQKMISDHASDPAVAHRAAMLLEAEIRLLNDKSHAGTSSVLAQARTLVTMLEQAVPQQVRASVQPMLDAAESSRPSSKPKASATPSSSPKPTSSPKATSSPKSTADPDDDGPLDTP